MRNLPTWAPLSIITVGVLLSPVLAFLMVIAVEILIDLLVEAGEPALPALVVTGAIGSSRALQYTAIGDAVNTASRLCSAAQPGQVILSEATFRKVQGDVAAVPLPPIRVKGKADELRVYNAVGLRNRTFPAAENTRPS